VEVLYLLVFTQKSVGLHFFLTYLVTLVCMEDGTTIFLAEMDLQKHNYQPEAAVVVVPASRFMFEKNYK
jgi:hypothetical protein